jgi:hypothetical protein
MPVTNTVSSKLLLLHPAVPVYNLIYFLRPFYQKTQKMSVEEEENMRPVKTLDDAWNSQDWDTFSERHKRT